jgi:hypothetical protein
LREEDEFLLIVWEVGPIMKADRNDAGWELSKVVAMDRKMQDELRKEIGINGPSYSFHTDDYLVEGIADEYFPVLNDASKSLSSEETIRQTNPCSDQNAQHSG